jgi:hypothetical protein
MSAEIHSQADTLAFHLLPTTLPNIPNALVPKSPAAFLNLPRWLPIQDLQYTDDESHFIRFKRKNGTERPTYDPKLVDRCFENYREHIHPLHPFLDLKVIKGCVFQFKEQPPTAADKSTHTIGVERCVSNAIVLLILALSMFHDIKQDVMPALPRSRLSCCETCNCDADKDVVCSLEDGLCESSGMDCYITACEIYGGLRGRYTLPYAHVALLAGLYMAKWAQVEASHDWITHAGKICQHLIDQ